jgi:uncharacterized glyoxalase superfamily protein PhnB
MSHVPNIVAITPVLVVDRIEPALPFWRDTLGYKVLVEVPHGPNLGFVLLDRGSSKLMMQTRDSIAADLPALASRDLSSVLYIDVESLDVALQAMKDVPHLVPPRTTFYGAREFVVGDPNGHVVIFAEHTGG